MNFATKKEETNFKNIQKSSDYNYDSIFFGIITSLKLFKDKFLFAGTGNFLSIYNIENDNLEQKFKIFNSEKISKINIFNYTSNNFFLTISGETKIKYSYFSENDMNFEFKEIKTKSNDYIMDHLLYINIKGESKEEYLIIGFINNFIEIYNYNKKENKFEFIKYIFSSVKCIVYSMAFSLNKIDNTQQNYDSILIASGTVFSKVIVWMIKFSQDKNEFIKEENNLALSGHKGVIFSVHFYSNNTLCSTSDDRITKFWKFDIKNKKYECDDYTGHSSRVWDSKVFEPQNILVSISEDATAIVFDLSTKKCIGKLCNGHKGWNIRSVEINKEYIWTGGEDGRLLKWKYSKKCENNDSQREEGTNEEITYQIKNEGKQYELACIKQKQKNFKCSIKVVKFLNENIVLISTNHGQILGYDINKNEISYVFYEDKEARVINSLDIIYEYNIILSGLNDGYITLISYDNLNDNTGFKSNLIQMFNERVTFISHKMINDYELFLIFSSENSKIKICSINNNINQINIIKTLENKNSFLYFISPFPSQINSFEIIKINDKKHIRDKNRYILFLGDYEGKIYFTQLKKIENHFFILNKLIKHIPIFKKSIITSIIYSFNQKILFVHSRNNKIKKYILINEYDQSLYSLKEIDSQAFQGISSYEKILYRDMKSFDEEDYFIIGHDGRDLIIYDTSQQKIIHRNDVKGVNKPLDLFLNYKNNKIYYISCQSEKAKLFKINIGVDEKDNFEKNNNGNLLVKKSYCLPINGRVIHDINVCSLKNNKYLIFTAGEDTQIIFYWINSIEKIFDINMNKRGNLNESIIYLGDFNMHNCAVRKILFIKEINNEFYFCSIGAKKEVFIFKLNIDNMQKPKFICISNLSEKDKDINKSKNKIENSVENSRNMDLCLMDFGNDKYSICITDTIDETSIYNIDLNNDNHSIMENSINKNSIKFTSSNFIPLCICHCSNKYILYGQSNGVLRIYSNDNKEEKYFKLHEAGINEIKVFKREISQNVFLVFTCGEDCSLVISEFDINKNEINVINKIKNIHYSAIKSVDIIQYNKDLIIITGGYDQIINVLLFNLEKYIIKVIKKFNACTSEINSIKGTIVKDEKSEVILIYIFIGGLGMEFLKLKFQ